jgi:hypothetical protein
MGADADVADTAGVFFHFEDLLKISGSGARQALTARELKIPPRLSRNGTVCHGMRLRNLKN